MTITSSKMLLALAVSAALASPALAQQQGNQQGQSNQQGGQLGQQQMGPQGGQWRQQGQQMGGQQARVPEQYRQEHGRIVAVRPVRVRGVNTPNYLVVLETQPGRRIVADIGQNRQAVNLQQGAPFAVRGQVVRVGNRGALLLADAVRVGNRVYDVNRPAYRRTGTGGQGW
ncbi:hypothetical protein [Microvirga roseola]|uniref:hypothetical protein n=1 Tax=Microvirga roseola TaxID=2883126 RepID=UPI001E5671CD|nr:hypothetical protein [Microvirga roseola]